MRLQSWLVDRNVLLAIAAAAMGGCAYLLAHRYLSTQAAVTRQHLAGQYAMREVMVAASALPAGATLAAAMLARRAVPERFLASDALDANGAAEVLGRKLNRALNGGEPVTASALSVPVALELSALVAPGLRALTIPVDESSAAAGLISPGDFVDLLLVTHADEAGAGAASVRPLLQAVRVVATGQQLQRHPTADGVGEEGTAGAGAPYATVTLHVLPEDAERVLLAQRLGELAVLLRPAGDSEPAALRPVDATNLFGGPARHRAALKLSRVQFIIGGLGTPARLHSLPAAHGPRGNS